jgi:hypothetical protein
MDFLRFEEKRRRGHETTRNCIKIAQAKNAFALPDKFRVFLQGLDIHQITCLFPSVRLLHVCLQEEVETRRKLRQLFLLVVFRSCRNSKTARGTSSRATIYHQSYPNPKNVFTIGKFLRLERGACVYKHQRPSGSLSTRACEAKTLERFCWLAFFEALSQAVDKLLRLPLPNILTNLLI